MATALTVQTALAPFATVSAGLLDYTYAVADVTGNTFPCTGREILLVINPAGGSTYTLTITGSTDEKNRSGAITSYSMAAGDYIIWMGGLTNSSGWKDASTGLITATANNAAVLMAVIRLPVGSPS
jgi:hypothetical protein